MNWLKRSSICPLCRTDIEQSLAPNSPQRFPTSTIPRSYPPAPNNQVPQLTFPIRPIPITNDVPSSNRVQLTDRVVEQLSNGNSRVSIAQIMRERNN